MSLRRRILSSQPQIPLRWRITLLLLRITTSSSPIQLLKYLFLSKRLIHPSVRVDQIRNRMHTRRIFQCFEQSALHLMFRQPNHSLTLCISYLQTQVFLSIQPLHFSNKGSAAGDTHRENRRVQRRSSSRRVEEGFVIYDKTNLLYNWRCIILILLWTILGHQFPYPLATRRPRFLQQLLRGPHHRLPTTQPL